MRSSILALLCFIITLPTVFGQERQAIKKQDLDLKIEQKIAQTNDVFHWNTASTQELWSASIIGDSLMSIGYKPADHIWNKEKINTIDIHSKEWRKARKNILKFIHSETNKKYPNRSAKQYLQPMADNPTLPYFNIRVFDYDIIEKLKSMPEVRYIEPMAYTLDQDLRTGGSGCSNYAATPNVNDYTSISPQSRQSWHHGPSNIASAWTKSNHGSGIWIAVVDSGIAPTQSKLGADFTEGDSGGRVIEKYGFFDNNGGSNYDGPDDDCGHGTVMSGLAAAPRGFDNTPAGVAYGANLISYRGTNDVVIDESGEINGVALSITDAANDSRVNIISMSLGDVFSHSAVDDAIDLAYANGKLIFAAGGTSTVVTAAIYGVIWPASNPETVAITGITDDSSRERCSNCHSGQAIDFVVVMQRDGDSDRTGVSTAQADHSNGYVGGSSNATATSAGIAALIWGNFPTWTRDQVLSRMIQHADYYPNRDGQFGYGLVDVCAAVDVNTAGVACTDSVSNEVEIEITSITFPSASEFWGSDNEWVVTFNGESYYFSGVNENGETGTPSQFHDSGVCGTLPVIIDLGLNSCGSSVLSFPMAIHENDSVTDNCTNNSGDDYSSSGTAIVDFETGSFSYYDSGNNLTFNFSFVSSCFPTVTPAVSVDAGPDLCLNDPDGTVNFYFSGGTPPYTVEYNIDGGSTLTANSIGNTASISQSALTAGTYSYHLESVTDANGCTRGQIGMDEVVVHNLPMATSGQVGTGCVGDDLVLTEYGTQAVAWNWTTSGLGTFDDNTLQSPTVTGASHGDLFTVLITDANGCNATHIVNAVFNNLPTPNAVALPVCVGDDVLLTENGDINITSWNWSTSGAGTFDNNTNQNPIVSGAANGDTFTVQVSDSNGCTATQMVTAVINNRPTAMASAIPICTGQDLVLAENGDPMTTSWNWSTSGAGIFDDNTLQNPTVTGAADGDSFSVIVANANGCMASNSFLAVVHDLPTAMASALPVCSGQDLVLAENGDPMTTSWNWSTSGAGTFDDNTLQNPTVTGAADGDSFSVIVANANGCMASNSFLAVVHDLPTAMASALPVCSGQDLVLAENGDPMTTSWNWSTSGAGTFDDNTLQNPTVTGAADGDSFSVIVANANGCMASNSFLAVVHDLPTPSITASTPCEGDDINLTENGDASIVSWAWSTSGTSSFDNNSISNPTASGSVDNDQFTVVVSDGNGCQATTSMNVTILDRPTLNASYVDPSNCTSMDGTITFTFTNVPDGTYSIDYNGGSFSGVSVVGNMSVIGSLGEGIYDDLRITNNGCTSVEDVDITLVGIGNCNTCVVDTIISAIPTMSDTISAIQTITTSGIVILPNGSVEVFRAGDFILMEDGFEVIQGADFEAYIEDCSNPPPVVQPAPKAEKN